MEGNFTPEELEELKQKGIDPSTVEVKGAPQADSSGLTNSEVEELKAKGLNPADYQVASQEPSQSEEKPSVASTVGRTAKRHFGGYAGGAGGAALASWLLGPEVGLPVSIIAGATGALGGSMAGQKAQDVLQGDEATAKQEAEYEEAAKENPKTALATDVIGSAVVGGGKPSLKNISLAGRQALGKNALESGEQALLNDLGTSELSASSLAKLEAQKAGREAIGKIAMGGAVNPAVNTGLDLATGRGLPSGTDLAAQVLGGGLFSNQAKWAARLHGHAEEKPPIDVQAEVTPVKQQDESLQKPSPYTEIGENSQPRIGDDVLKNAYVEQLIGKKTAKDFTSPEDSYAYKTKVKALNNLSPDELRLALHKNYLEKQANTPEIKIPTSNEQSNIQATGEGTKVQTDEAKPKEEVQATDGKENNNQVPLTAEEKAAVLKDEGLEEAAKKRASISNPNETEDTTLKAHIESGKATVGSVLEHIANNQYSEYRGLAKAIAESSPKEKLNDPVKIDPTEYSSYYDDTKNEVGLHPTDVNHKTALHEIIHAVTANNIPLDWSEMHGVELNKAMNKYVASSKGNPALKELIKTYQETLDKLGLKETFLGEGGLANDGNNSVVNRHGRDSYGLNNLHEFMAEAATHQKFQQKLNEMQSSVKGQTLWQRFVNSVRGVLGLSVNQNSLLERALSATEGIVKTERAWDGNRMVQGLHENMLHRNAVNKVFGSVHDKIASIPDERAPIVAGAFKQTLNKAEQLRGEWTNKFLKTIDTVGGLSDNDKVVLNKVMDYENKTGEQAPSTMLRTLKQKAIYKTAKMLLGDVATNRERINEPVYRDGRPTPLERRPNYWPTTLDQKVAEAYRNVDKDAISKYDKDFLDNQKAYGKKDEDAIKALKEFKESIGGKSSSTPVNLSRFNAARLSHDVPLPESFRTKDWVKNMTNYFNRMAMDNAHFEHVESNPKVMEALGEKKDAWRNDIPQTGGESLSNNKYIRTALDQFHGEAMGTYGKAEHGWSSLLATMFISNPAIEMHKLTTNLINGPLAQVDNPKEFAGVLKSMITNIGKGAEHAEANGAVSLNASKVSDLLDRNVDMVGKLQAISKGIRNIGSVGNLIPKLGTDLVQNGFEYLLPSKVERANNGDKTQQAFLKKLDPTYEVGKQYNPQEVSQLASQALQYTQGTHDIRTMPSWMLHDTEISGFFKLAHWSISQTNRFMSDVYEPFKKGDIKPMVNALFGSLVGGYLIKELREKLQGKHSSVPDLSEIAASDRGLAGNKGLVAYNAMAAAQYAGFAGVVSQIMKYPFDIVYKNKPQGAIFPADEIASDLVSSIGHIASAAANDPHFDWARAGTEFANHLLQTDVQLARVVYNQGINTGAIKGAPAEKKQLADKLGELRRFQQVSGLPFDEQSPDQSNPFMNLEQKDFKRTTDIGKAIQMLPELIAKTMETYGNNPDVMMEKLKSLKQNHYETIPSIDNLPLQAMKYIGYLQRKEGPEYAQGALKDFLQHKAINEVKASAVP